MRREKLLKWIAVFFCAMLLFTFLSRAADSVSVARVQASTIQNQMITHQVSGSGTIEGTQEEAVFTLENQKVAQVLVQAGETVKKGQALFTVLDSSIQEAIDQKEDEIQEKELALSDLESQKSIDSQKKSYESSRAQQDLDTALGNGDVNIANAQNELNIAIQRLEDYRAKKAEALKEAEKQKEKNEFSSTPDFSDGSGQQGDGTSNNETDPYQDNSEEQALEDDVRAKRESLNQVIISRNQEVTAADRAVQDAAIPSAQDSTDQNLKRQLGNLKEELAKLQDLKANNGEVQAPSDGVVKNLSVKTGGQTTQESAAVLYKLSGEMKMMGTVDSDDLEYVEAGGKVTLEGNGGKTVDTAQVQSVQEDPENPGSFLVTVSVPDGSFSIGENVEFTITKETGPYKSCVPLSALYGTEGQQYVFVIDTQSSVLGEVQVARKVDVTVQEQNETRAALQDGVLSASQKVITDTDRGIEDGSRVRLQET